MASAGSIQDALEASRDRDPGVRRRAVRDLCPCAVKRNDAEIWSRILEMSRDPDGRVRRMALHSMIDGSPAGLEAEVVAALEGLRNDADLKLRRHVRKILARYRRTGKLNEAQV